MHKLSRLVGNEWVEYTFPPVFAFQGERIVSGVPGGDPGVFERLVTSMSEPIMLLYILHTPRGEAEVGRYQSPELSMKDFRSFVAKYHAFLKGDARFDIWAHSQLSQATVIWDRHNELFGDGPIQHFATDLSALGFTEGVVHRLEAHQHHYREELDHLARQLIVEYAWIYSPLRPEDEQ